MTQTMSSLTRLLFILSLLAGAAILACGGGDDATGNQDGGAAIPRPTAAYSAQATEARTTGSTQSSQPAQSDAQTPEPGQQATTRSSATPASAESEPTATPEPALPARPTSTPAPTPRPQVANPSLETDRAALIALYEAADAENNWVLHQQLGQLRPPGDLVRRRSEPRDRQGNLSGPHRLRRPAGDQL